jgi:hypothetical protein
VREGDKMRLEILLYKWGDEGGEREAGARFGLGASLVARGITLYTVQSRPSIFFFFFDKNLALL